MYTFFLTLLAGIAIAQTPPGFTPSANATLPASYKNIVITPGIRVPRNATLLAPTLASSTPSVTLLIDLDTPYASLNRTFAPYVHWITSSSNSSVIPYIAPNPPAGSPEHRYVLLEYAYPGNQTIVMPPGFEGVGKGGLMSRVRFDLEGFVSGARLGLSGVRAANWFTVVHEGGNGTASVEYTGYAGEGVRMGWVWVVSLGALGIGFVGMCL